MTVKNNNINKNMNVFGKLPKTKPEADLLKLSIADLLRQIPESWSEFDSDILTTIQARVLFLMVAADLPPVTGAGDCAAIAET